MQYKGRRTAPPKRMEMPDVRGPGDLVVFSFVSKVRPDLPTSTLLRLARQSWRYNLKMGLTGELSLRGEVFAEEIEGPCDIIQPLAARILADDRHGSIRIQAFRRLAARRHAGWTTTGFDLARMPVDLDTIGETAIDGNLRVLGMGRTPSRRATAS